MTPAQSGHLAMLLFSMLVAGSFALGVLAANDIAPAVLNALRFWIAAVLVGAAAAFAGQLRLQFFQAPWRYFMMAAFLATYFVMMFEGLKTANPVSAAAVFTLTPIMSGLFGWLLMRQKMTGRIALALGIGAIGAVWVIFRADVAALLRFDVGRGEMIYFIGCVAHAIYTPLVPKMNRGEPTVVFTFGTLVAGAIILTVWGWPEMQATQWNALPNIVWITILYTAIFASAMTFVLLQFGAMRLPSSKVMAYTYLTPTWVIVWTLFLGAAAPTPLVLVGVAATVLALVMLLRD